MTSTLSDGAALTFTETVTTTGRRPRTSAGRATILSRGGALVGLVVLTLVTAFPVVVVTLAAFSPEAEVNSWPPALVPSTFTLENFADLSSRIPVLQQSWNSLVFSGAVTLCSLAFNALAAYALARMEFRGRTALFTVLVATMMIPFQALLVPIYQLVADLGWVNSFLGLVVPRAADVAGIFLLRQFFITLPRDLDSAARLDGAGEFRIFWQVGLRLLGPGLVTVFLFTLVATWNNYFLPLIMLNSSDLYPITVGLAQLQAAASQGGGSQALFSTVITGSLVSIVPLVLAFLFLQRYWQSGLATGSVKE